MLVLLLAASARRLRCSNRIRHQSHPRGDASGGLRAVHYFLKVWCHVYLARCCCCLGFLFFSNSSANVTVKIANFREIMRKACVVLPAFPSAAAQEVRVKTAQSWKWKPTLFDVTSGTHSSVIYLSCCCSPVGNQSQKNHIYCQVGFTLT